MRMWMIAEARLWEQLQAYEHLLCDPTLIDRDFLRAYQWLCRQMAKRLTHYEGHYPWWAWVQYEKKKPDLRSRQIFHYAPAKTPMVRLELEMPEQEVLCSDFDRWHFVLNRSYLAKNQVEDEWWEQLQPELRTLEKLEQSWESIFDLDYTGFDLDWWGEPSTSIQATFEYLHLSAVRDITLFTSRPPKRISY